MSFRWASREAFFRTFEGNFFDSLAKLSSDPQRIAAVKAHFMELLRTRYNPSFIPGMVDVIRALAPHCTLAVLSTNAIEVIRRVLVSAGIATCFSHVFAGDVEPRKAVSIRRFLSDQRYAAQRLCSAAYLESEAPTNKLTEQDVVLVTDTIGDVIEAQEAGGRAIGVAWGMHTEKKLLDAGAERVALWPQELIAWLRDGGTSDAACVCDATSAESCALPVASQARLSASDAVAVAARLRRERQLQARQAQQTLVAPALRRTNSNATPELLLALERIMRRDHKE